MKSLIIFFLVTASSLASAEISVVINNQVYRCADSSSPLPPAGGHCIETANLFGNTLDNCMRTYNGSYEKATACVSQLWPSFKSRKEECIYEGSLQCNTICIKHYNGIYEKTSACSQACK